MVSFHLLLSVYGLWWLLFNALILPFWHMLH